MHDTSYDVVEIFYMSLLKFFYYYPNSGIAMKRYFSNGVSVGKSDF